MNMMTSSNGNIFRVTGPLCGEFTGPGEFPAQRPVTRSFDVIFDLRLNKRLSKQNRDAGDLRRHRRHYDVNVMYIVWLDHKNTKNHETMSIFYGKYCATFAYPCDDLVSVKERVRTDPP